MARRFLRSQTWFRGADYYNFARRTYVRAEGMNADVFQGKPIIGICNSWSELNNCNLGLRDVAEAVKRGVWAAGGVPFEFPTISLGETFMRPTTMLFRNLMAMDVEESIRANPLDGVVLLCGCDKTTPAQLMGAASADIPAIMVPGGPMFAGNWRGKRIASGTDGRKLFDLYRARQTHRRRVERDRRLRVAYRRPLHGDGYSFHDDESRGSDGYDAAGMRCDSRARCPAESDRRTERPADRRNGE